MKQAITAILFLALLAISFPAGDDHADAAGDEQKLCPIMGFEINRDIFTDYKSLRVYFCCPLCPQEFKLNPEEYIETMRDKGVVLASRPA